MNETISPPEHKPRHTPSELWGKSALAMAGLALLLALTALYFALPRPEPEEPEPDPVPETETILYRGQELPVWEDVPVNTYQPSDFFVGPNGWLNYEKDGQKAAVGVDVSFYQGDIDWQKVAASGVDFAIIRLGYRGYSKGVLQMDSKFEQNIQGALDAGLEVGDILKTFNGVTLTTNEQLAELMQQNGGAPIRVEVKRGNSLFFSTLQPVLSSGDGQYRLGVWVRDSSAGIGTMTYLDQNSGLFTGLGHAVCDVDTGELMPLSNGEAVPARITGCKKGEAGTPGELKGKFTEEPALGSLSANTTSGVYGLLRSRTLYTGEELPLAMKHEVHTGAAYIYTTVEGTQPQRYEIEIEKLMMNEEEKGQNMVIHVVDPALLAATGGIVQGMWVRYNRGNTGNA